MELSRAPVSRSYIYFWVRVPAAALRRHGSRAVVPHEAYIPNEDKETFNIEEILLLSRKKFDSSMDSIYNGG